MKKKWYKQKTTWAGITGIVTAIAGAMTGTIPVHDAIQLALVALVGIFLRQGVENTKKE